MVMAAVRVTLGLLWLSNLGWKIPPNFGQGTAGGLYLYVTDAVSHPVLPPYSWVIEHFVLPHFTAFGWATLALETLLAGLLLTGTLTRVTRHWAGPVWAAPPWRCQSARSRPSVLPFALGLTCRPGVRDPGVPAGSGA